MLTTLLDEAHEIDDAVSLRRRLAAAEAEQDRLNAALAEAETRLQDFLEIGSDWVWETDAELRFVRFAGRMTEVSGVRPEQLLGKTRREVMADATSPAARQHLAALDARRPFRDFAYEAETPAGRRHFKISGRPAFGRDGAFLGYRGTGCDITAEIEARQRADRTFGRFTEAIESIPASLMLCDADDRIVVCNSVTRDYFPRVPHLLVPGTRFEDLLRGHAESGILPEAQGRVEEWVAQRMLAHRNPAPGAITRLWSDGRWVQIIERRSAEGGIVGIRLDVTELKHKEQQLAHNSALLQATLDNIGQGISVYDAELRLIASNHRFLEVLELPDELGRIGSSFADYVRFNCARGDYGPGDAEHHLERIKSLIRQPHRLERTSGSGRVVEVQAQPLPGGGWVATYTDITDRKRAEQAIESHARRLARYAEDLERSNAELERFAYVASHDLQEPLRMVASYCQLLQRRYKGKLDGDADEFIGYAVEGATRMQRMINDLLAYSRVGRKGRAFAPVACGEIVAAAVSNLRAAIEESGAEIAVGALPTLDGDKTLLGQLFQNLIGNGIKFRRDEPIRISVEAREQGDDWLFTVRDNGIGIEKDYVERVFLLFQRLHDRTKYAGTGIGLAICKKVVERHGGRIWIESEPGQGTTFHFTLAAKAPAKGEDDELQQ